MTDRLPEEYQNPTVVLALLDQRDALRAEVERLRGEGTERGWLCSTCRTWEAPYRPEESLGSVLSYKPCPRCPGAVMLCVTHASVERDDARAALAEWQSRVAVLEEEARAHPLAAALAESRAEVAELRIDYRNLRQNVHDVPKYDRLTRTLAERDAALDRVRALRDRWAYSYGFVPWEEVAVALGRALDGETTP